MSNRKDVRNLSFIFMRHNYQLALVCLSLVFSGFVTAQNPTPDYTELEKGLVLDLNGNVGYFINPNGTINSINLSNGQSRWNTSQKGKPLAFLNNQLLVQLEDSIPSNDFTIGYIDNSSGSVSREESRTLASEIKTAVKSTMKYSFETRVKIINNQVNLSWDFEPTNMRGLIMSDEQATGTKGVFRINQTDLSMGNLGMNNFSLDGPMISVELDNNTIPNIPGRQFTSIQSEYIVAVERVSNDSQWKKYKWTIYTRDGTSIGSIRTNLSFRPFYVVDGVLIFTTAPVIRNIGGELVEEPKSLVGYDLSTGNQKWKKELLDLEYRGPYPP